MFFVCPAVPPARIKTEPVPEVFEDEHLYINDKREFHSSLCNQSIHLSFLLFARVCVAKTNGCDFIFFPLLLITKVCVQTGEEKEKKKEDSLVFPLSRKSFHLICESRKLCYFCVFYLEL